MFEFTAEQDDLRSTVRSFLAARSPESEVRRLMASERGWNPDTWRQMAELGLQSIAIPERFGGAGYGMVELQIVLEEMGRALLCAPFFASVVLAANALLAAEDDALCQELLPEVARGALILTLAVSEAGVPWNTEQLATTAAETDGRWKLSGEKLFVLDGTSADQLLVLAQTAHGPTLFLVEQGADGLRSEAMATLDQTRRQARLTLDATPARLVGELGAGARSVAATLDQALPALSAEQVGTTRRLLELAVEYAKLREQFGRPIGSFQAVKHLCTGMLVDAELATSAAYAAGWSIDEKSAEAPMLARLAQAACADASTRVAADAIEVHGGIGFTWEHPAHLFYKRAMTSATLLGSASTHRRVLAQLLA